MIIATIALLTILFGGALEVYFIDDFEGSIETVIEDKDRRKALISDLESSAELVGAFNKHRKSALKQYKKASKSKSTTRNQYDAIFSSLESERAGINQLMAEQRVAFLDTISDAQWQSILEVSNQAYGEKKASAAKKQKKSMDKGKSTFYRTRQSLQKSISDQALQEQLIQSLDDLTLEIVELEKTAETYNLHNPAFKNKYSSQDELLATLNQMHELRTKRFDSLVSFQITLSEVLSNELWKPVNKAFNKDLTITAH